MQQARAKRILALLGWGHAEAARQYNKVARTRLQRQDVYTQLNSKKRGVSDGFAVFLRMAVHVARMERRYRPEACGRSVER
ncbi:hypothetical protein HUE56_21470 [Azospirillum oryzae]|uniref:Uncharacterized protein n=1 Tax=Azospirillum oryzae TaxID=286727 RepID=A0A6N1ANT9_9PROT|nr:hypothetical protein [Azospirillum oryzae]KAA0590554.1 hypothetical protein FZ938_00105 [Azospirillum oryzae]QKS52918.1 hypothetical protein HUE56_21470 [Azospirillum oryzae]GLR80139.1 hypothetical protein GCM10007856_28160 [Azospirillum oryzae]